MCKYNLSVMIPVLDPDPEWDFQLFGDSVSEI